MDDLQPYLPDPQISALESRLEAHEHRSQERYESLCDEIKSLEWKDKTMSDGINTDKVIVNAGSGGGSDGGAGLAAVIAALGNRNQGNDNAALIAALGNRNETQWGPIMASLLAGRNDGDNGNMAAVIAALGNRNQGNDNAALIAALGNRNDNSANMIGPLMAMLGDRRGDDGMNNLWPIILLALLGRGGRGGLFGGGDDCGGGGGAENRIQDNAQALAILGKLGNLEAAVPASALQTQNSILEQQIALSNQITNGNVAIAAAVTNAKDTTQNATALLLQAGNNNTNQLSAQIAALSTKIDTNTIADLQRQLAVAQLDARDEKHFGKARETEINVAQTVTQNQAQAQFQAQAQANGFLLNNLCNLLAENTQYSKIAAANANFNIGNTGAVTTGAQTLTPTSTQIRT